MSIGRSLSRAFVVAVSFVLVGALTLPASANGCGSTLTLNLSPGLNPHVLTTPGPDQVHIDEGNGATSLTLALAGPCLLFNVTGTAGNDRIVFDDFDFGPIVTSLTVNGAGGNDRITLQDGFTVASGTNGLAQVPMVDGGTGTNTLIVDSDEDFTIAGAAGAGTLVPSVSSPLAFQSIATVILRGGASANTMDAAAWSGGVTLRGKDGADDLTGGAGVDGLFGGPGVDHIDAMDTFTHDVVNGGGSSRDVCLVDPAEPSTGCELFA